MCDAITPTMMMYAALATSVASTGASLYAQKEQADAQASYQSAMAEEYARTAKLNQEAANREYVEQSAAERISQMQKTDSAAEELQSLQREKLEKQGQALASAESAGQALAFLMGDYERSAAQKRSLIEQQLDMIGVEADTSIRAMKDKAEARMKSQSNYVGAPISQPNYLGGALSILGSGVSAYDKFIYQPKMKAQAKGATIE